jgi:hypothetical protein
VIAGLTADRDVAVPEFSEPFGWKELLPALDFLQAQNVGLGLAQEARDQIEPQADGVYVPGGDSQCHGHKKKRPTPAKVGRFCVFTRAPGGKPALEN